MILVICSEWPLLSKKENEKFVDYENRVFDCMEVYFSEIKNHFIFNNKPLRFRYLPEVNGRAQVLWHITSTSHGGERHPDPTRMETALWAYYLLFTCFDTGNQCSYAWIRKYTKRIHIWCVSLQYIVVLEERAKYVLFITAYPTNRIHTQDKLYKEYHEAEEKYIL